MPLDANGSPFDPKSNPDKIEWKNKAYIPKDAFELDTKNIFVGTIGFTQPIFMDPIPTVGTPLFNEGAGFASFLVPIILILIIHQTLFLGIGMHAGTSREENRFHEFVSFAVHRNSTVKVVLGKSLTYFLMYGA